MSIFAWNRPLIKMFSLKTHLSRATFDSVNLYFESPFTKAHVTFVSRLRGLNIENKRFFYGESKRGRINWSGRSLNEWIMREWTPRD